MQPQSLLRRLARLVVGAWLGGVAATPAFAAEIPCPRPPVGVDVVVAIRDAPPFIIDDPIRGERGFSLDLWESIEDELRAEGLIGRTELVSCSLGAQLKALGSGEVDIVISPLTITAARLEYFDFTHQYLSSGTTVAQRSASAIDFRYAASIIGETLGHRGMPRAIMIFLLANLVLAALMAWALRQHSDYDQIRREPRPVRWIRYALEAILRTIGLRSMGDGLRSTSTTVLEVSLAIVGTILSAIIFGVLTSALVGSIGVSREVALTDLPDMRVATLVDSTSQSFLEGLAERAEAKGGGVARVQPASLSPGGSGETACVPAEVADGETWCVATETWEAAVALLAAGGVDAVFGDWAQLSYLSRLDRYADAISVQATTFWNEPYGWGVAPTRPALRAAIDRALVRRLRSPEWRSMVQEYMGDGAIAPN